MTGIPMGTCILIALKYYINPTTTHPPHCHLITVVIAIVLMQGRVVVGLLHCHCIVPVPLLIVSLGNSRVPPRDWDRGTLGVG